MLTHMSNPTYLDNNATTKVAPEVLEAMLPSFKDFYGNPSSIHTFGGSIQKEIEKAREKVAQLINAYPDEIIFTSCGTESDNTAFHSAGISFPEKTTYITTKVEHSAIINYAQKLEKEGKKVIWLDVNEKGQLDMEEFEQVIHNEAKSTALVSIMYANNETGTIFPIEQIAQIVKSHGILFHVDAVQIVGKKNINMQKTPIDFLALSGHKLHAPKGIGALYVKRGTRYYPLIVGGHQEKGRRAGTENVPYIIGLGKAAELALNYMEEEKTKVAQLRDKLERTLTEKIPHIKINGDIEHRLPNTTNISFKNIEGEALLLMLNTFGICASSGSACTSGSLEPSHVLRAMNVPYNYAHGSIRFSLSRYTTEEDINKVIETLPQIVTKLREMSPFKD